MKNKNVVIDGQNLRNIFILKDNAKLTLINITIKNSLNSAIFSQGSYTTGSTKLSLINCNFYNNNGKNTGGAIYFNNNGEISINNCIFENNKGIDWGGGEYFSR